MATKLISFVKKRFYNLVNKIIILSYIMQLLPDIHYLYNFMQHLPGKMVHLEEVQN